ncbi:MAG TPA: nucleotidyltransferase family protein [Pyrinomonadaceae bacterium]|jgi:hypothetical protein
MMEHEILLCVARKHADRARLRELLRHSLDWDYLFSTASSHGLIPLLHKHLHSTCADLAPINFLSCLKRESVANTQNVLHLFAKQLKLYRLLQANDIPTAIFKGSLLAQMAYGEIALRHAGDIDVLISRAHFARARKLLESLGYQMMPSLTPAQLSSHLNTHCEIQFVRDDWFTVVDLHWGLAPKSFVFKMETEDVLTRLQRVSVAGVEFETLATEDLILYQAMHGAKHLWRRLEWISALGETIRAADSIDWDTVLRRAADAHATRMLALGLQLAERVSNISVPAPIDNYRSMADEILARIFDVSGPADSTETNLYNLKIMDRKRDALVSALRAIFVPTLTDWSSLHLPSSLHPLYYAYRPLRLSKIYSASLWQKLISRGAA